MKAKNSSSPSSVEKPTNTTTSNKELAAEHLPPIGLVFCVILCSGYLFMFAFRDVFATGKIIGGNADEDMLVRS